MLDLIRTFYRYNGWATDRLLSILNDLSPAQYTVPGCSGYGSIRETLVHLLGFQADWILACQSASVYGQSTRIRLVMGDCDTVDVARHRWDEVGALTNRFIDSLGENELGEMRRISLPDGSVSELRLGETLLHIANHATHTRGQIVAAVRRDGLNPGDLDMIEFLRLPDQP